MRNSRPTGFRLYAPAPGWLVAHSPTEGWVGRVDSPPRFYLCCAGAHYSRVGIILMPAAGSRGGFPYLFPTSVMLTGTVKFYNDSKGFGFIVADDNQEEIFVHQTGLIHEIQEGDRVEFDIKEGKKGPNAVKVTRLE